MFRGVVAVVPNVNSTTCPDDTPFCRVEKSRDNNSCCVTQPIKRYGCLPKEKKQRRPVEQKTRLRAFLFSSFLLFFC